MCELNHVLLPITMAWRCTIFNSVNNKDEARLYMLLYFSEKGKLRVK